MMSTHTLWQLGEAIPIFHFTQERPQRASVVTIAHEQNIICTKTRLDVTTHEQTIICRQLFAGHVVGSQPMKTTPQAA